MCGIVGIIDREVPVSPAEIDAKRARIQGRIDAMRACIVHRGPDAGGAFVGASSEAVIGLGAQRLSIVDLTPAGNMPMSNEDGKVLLVYNGEIYNHAEIRAELESRGHRYRSRTDTETVIHAYEEYGTGCFARFNGIFACVIYDSRNGRIVMARDRAGVKPLYYAPLGRTPYDGALSYDRGLVFASELKALLRDGAVPAEVDSLALDIYLALGYVPAPYSLIRGVRKLPAASYAVYEDGQLTIERYWQPSLALHTPRRTWGETVAATRAVVSDAISRQMMSDVPVGVMLSGGLDSSIVAAVAQRTTGEPLHTFSIGFETRASELEHIYNLDRDHAREVSEALGTVHHEITLSDVTHGSEGLEPLLRRLVAQLDEPVWEPSFASIYLMSSLARKHGVKVLLSGDGSDELFGGYPWHPALARLEQIERLPGLRPVLGLLSRAPLPNGTGLKVQDLARKYRSSDLAKYHAQYEVFDGGTRARLFGRTPAADPLDDLIAPLFAGGSSFSGASVSSVANGHGSLPARFGLVEFFLWVGEHFNQRLDRMTMAASVEGRVPFQDNEVVDLALAMPVDDKLRQGIGKAPLRAAFADLVPEAVLQRRKRPFAAPATAWMHGALRPLVTEALGRESLARLPGLDPEVALGPLERFSAGLPVRQEQIWTLLHLALWLDDLENHPVSPDPLAGAYEIAAVTQ